MSSVSLSTTEMNCACGSLSTLSPAVPTDSEGGGLELMMSSGFVPVSAENSSSRTSPPMPPPTGSAMPIPRRSSMFPLPARPCHLIDAPRGPEAQRQRPRPGDAASVPTKPLSYDAGAMDLQLSDSVALVTGSSRGIGLAISHALAAEGCRVSLCARTEARLTAAAALVAQTAGSADRVLAVTAEDRKSVV